MSAGQAGASQHIMVVLQVYQADQLGDLDQGVGPLRWLLSCAANEKSSSTGHQADLLIVAMEIVATERYLWLNLADIGEKEKAFSLICWFHPLSFSEHLRGCSGWKVQTGEDALSCIQDIHTAEIRVHAQTDGRAWPIMV